MYTHDNAFGAMRKLAQISALLFYGDTASRIEEDPLPRDDRP